MLLQIENLNDSLSAVAEGMSAMEEPIEQSINLWTMAQYGGWIMIILALLFAWGVYIFIERMVVLKSAMKEDKSFMDRIRDYIHEGKMDSAVNLCRQTDTPASRMVEKGISRIGHYRGRSTDVGIPRHGHRYGSDVL